MKKQDFHQLSHIHASCSCLWCWTSAAGSRLNYTRRFCDSHLWAQAALWWGAKGQLRGKGGSLSTRLPNKCWRKQAHQLAAPGAHWLINGRAISRESWRACGYCQPRLAPAAPALSRDRYREDAFRSWAPVRECCPMPHFRRRSVKWSFSKTSSPTRHNSSARGDATWKRFAAAASSKVLIITSKLTFSVNKKWQFIWFIIASGNLSNQIFLVCWRG